jgi:hypothetical protein
VTKQADWSHTPDDPLMRSLSGGHSGPGLQGKGPPETVTQTCLFIPSDLLRLGATDTFYALSSRPKGQS